MELNFSWDLFYDMLIFLVNTIDMLTMLREKTQGNLNTEENKLLEQLIYELQMKYVAKTKDGGPGTPTQ